MGKLSTLRKTIEKNPEGWYRVLHRCRNSYVKLVPGMSIDLNKPPYNGMPAFVETPDGNRYWVFKKDGVWHQKPYVERVEGRMPHGAYYRELTRTWEPCPYTRSYRDFVKKIIMIG